MLLYIVRHGETQWNRETRLAGRSDIPLNETGRKLTEITAEALKDIDFDLCISSPLIRAKETAKIILGDRKTPVITDDRITEISFGEYEGRVCIKEDGTPVNDPVYLPFRYGDLRFPGMPGGESFDDVLKRSGAFLDELLADPDYQDKTILITTHGCLYRGLLHRFYQDQDRYWDAGVPKNCAVSVVRANNGKAELILKDKIYYDPSLALRYF